MRDADRATEDHYNKVPPPIFSTQEYQATRHALELEEQRRARWAEQRKNKNWAPGERLTAAKEGFFALVFFVAIGFVGYLIYKLF